MQLFLDLSVLEHIYFLPWLYTCPLVIKPQYSSSTSLSFSFGKFSTFLPIFLCLLSLEFILLVKNMFFHVSLFLNVLLFPLWVLLCEWVSVCVCFRFSVCVPLSLKAFPLYQYCGCPSVVESKVLKYELGVLCMTMIRQTEELYFRAVFLNLFSLSLHEGAYLRHFLLLIAVPSSTTF